MPEAAGKVSRLKALAQEAASKVDVLERFEKAATAFERFGGRIATARRKAIAACGLAALGVGAGLILFTFPKSLVLAPLLGIFLGSCGALLVPASPIEQREDDFRSTIGLIDQAKERGLLNAVAEGEEHLIRITAGETANQPRALLSSGTAASEVVVPQEVIEGEVISAEPNVPEDQRRAAERR